MRPMPTRKWNLVYGVGNSHVFSGRSSHPIALCGSSLRPSTIRQPDSAITVCVLTYELPNANTAAVNLFASLRDDLRMAESLEITRSQSCCFDCHSSLLRNISTTITWRAVDLYILLTYSTPYCHLDLRRRDAKPFASFYASCIST